MVSFTGSSAVGREVMAAAAATMKRILLECGGKSAAIFLDDVEVTDELLQRILFDGCSLHAGQACILQSRLLLPERLHDDIVDRLVDAAQRIKVGDPTGPDVQMGPPISSEQRDRVEAHVAAALDDGASLAAGGRRPIGLNGGFYCEPTILTDVGPDSRIAQEEVFGPVLTVLRYRDDDDAVAIANNSLYGLSGAVWGADVDRAVAVARRVRTGQIAVNGCIPGDAPFGGFNQSGFGRDCGGLRGLHQYMEPKAIGIPT
jgi:acyl-CoA reductase-like NAD-dependent aldehyde dehydrogenase